jgi:LPS O-antigen subunit length determinant protein (WzzB/FepE family)
MEDGPYDQTKLDALVARVLNIQDITSGNPDKDFIVRYRGMLLTEDSEEAYDRLAGYLEPLSYNAAFPNGRRPARGDSGQRQAESEAFQSRSSTC